MKPDETGIVKNQAPITPPFNSNHSTRPFKQQGSIQPEKIFEKRSGSAFKTPSTERIMYNKIQGANTAVFGVVQEIRTVDEAMEKICHHLNGMKHALDTILKSYPPFPAGSDERIIQLRQFSALRKMIDQLTIPPKNENSAAVILGDRQKHPEAGDWEYHPGPGSRELVVRHQQVHSGEQGLNLPDLGVDASDSDLLEARQRLTMASQTLEHRRKQFVADANHVIASMI